MKQEMQKVVAPSVLQRLKSIPTSSIDSNIRGSPSGYEAKQYSLSCAGAGEVYNAAVYDSNQKCGELQHTLITDVRKNSQGCEVRREREREGVNTSSCL